MVIILQSSRPPWKVHEREKASLSSLISEVRVKTELHNLKKLPGLRDIPSCGIPYFSVGTRHFYIASLPL